MISENPEEDSFNPFASPESMVQSHRGKSGEYQIVGNRIHGGKVMTLPDLCVRCGEKVREGDELATRMEKKLSWIHPATLVLIFFAWPIFILVALLTRKKCSVAYSLCPECSAKRRWYWLAFGLLLASVAGMVVTALLMESPWPLMGMFVVIIGMAVTLSKINGPLSVAWYSNEVFQLKGAGPLFLGRAQPDQPQENFYAAVLAEDGRTA